MYYKYSVLSETGLEINGIEEGPLSVIKNRLKEKNFYILSLEPDIFRNIRSCFEKRKIKAQTLSVFLQDLVNMLKIGIAINEAIESLQESSSEPVLTKALGQINEDLSKGFSLAAAFERTGVFPWQVVSVLKVGEKSGNLEQVFSDLSLYYSREADFLRSLRNAVIYPLVVFSMLIAVMFYVSFKVIPHLEALLPIRGSAYFSARLLLFLSHFLKDFWYVCLLFPAGIVLIYLRLKKATTERFTDFYYRIPLIGQVAKDAAFSTFFSSLAVLQRNGISIIDSLSLIEETISYKFLAKKVAKLKDCIASGLSFCQALRKDPFFPRPVYTAVKKGEEIGLLDEYLEGLSKYYFERVTRRVRVILSFVQPALLIFCAIVLLFIISAFIVPVYSNLSNIAGGNIKF